jgi:dienelactone hydrolase
MRPRLEQRMFSENGAGPLKRWASGRRFRAGCACILGTLAVAACTVPEPQGAAPLRYRDQVFSNVTVTSNLQYGSAPDLNGNPVALTLDLYQPAGDTNTARPAVIWAHGGSFCCGSKTSPDMPALATYFAERGYVAASINYRLDAPSGCTGSSLSAQCITAALDAQHDAQAAVRWLRANASTYRIDPTRIAIGGESAGAIVATLVGVNSGDPGTSGNPGFSSRVGGWVSISGGLPSGAFVDSSDSPGLLFSGTADSVVPFSWSAQTASALLNAGVVAFLEPLDGAGHVPWTQYSGIFETQSDYFLYDLLDLAHAQGVSAAAGRAFDRQVRIMRRDHPRFARTLAGQLHPK